MPGSMGKYSEDRIFGIDLGTTYSSIAYVNDFGSPKIVPNVEGHHTTPSIVGMNGNYSIVGLEALAMSKEHPEKVVRYIKRFINQPGFHFEHGGVNFTVEELSSLILRKLVQDAEVQVGCKIKNVVITCPAYFGVNERESVRIAGEIAGLNVRQVINEPTAAAIAYGAAEMKEPKKIVVYDLGGGTFDITMIDIRPKSIKVIGTGGDPQLGGKDWNDRLVAYVAHQFYLQTGLDPNQVDILADHATDTEIHTQCEMAKKILSKSNMAEVAFHYQGKPYQVQITSQIFTNLTKDLIARTLDLTSKMLKNARKKGYNKFDEIILVGGSTYLPQVAKGINARFGLSPKLYHPEEAIARGAAIFGWKLFLRDRLVERIAQKVEIDMDLQEFADNLEKVARKAQDSQPSLDDLAGELQLSMDSSWDPTEKGERHRETKKTLEMELVDIKVDVPATVINDSVKEVAEDTGFAAAAVNNSMMEIQDVSSKSMGYVTKAKGQDHVHIVVQKNTNIPASGQKVFLTSTDAQKGVALRLVESEEDETFITMEDVSEIGKAWVLLPPDIPAKTRLKLTFSLNKEGRLQMRVREGHKGRKFDFTIQTTSVISGKELAMAKARKDKLFVQ